MLYRTFETYISRKGTARPQSQFLHSCFCVRFIHSHNRSAYSPAGKYVDRLWEYINRSRTHECGNLDWGRAVPFLGIHKLKFLCSVQYFIKVSWFAICGLKYLSNLRIYDRRLSPRIFEFAICGLLKKVVLSTSDYFALQCNRDRCLNVHSHDS